MGKERDNFPSILTLSSTSTTLKTILLSNSAPLFRTHHPPQIPPSQFSKIPQSKSNTNQTLPFSRSLLSFLSIILIACLLTHPLRHPTPPVSNTNPPPSFPPSPPGFPPPHISPPHHLPTTTHAPIFLAYTRPAAPTPTTLPVLVPRLGIPTCVVLP